MEMNYRQNVYLYRWKGEDQVQLLESNETEEFSLEKIRPRDDRKFDNDYTLEWLVEVGDLQVHWT